MNMNMNMNIPELPDSIKAKFQPFQSIDPCDNRYTASPLFVGYPDNHLLGWSFAFEHGAEDGTKWMIRQYSPRRSGGDHYHVVYCRVVEPFKKNDTVVTLVDLGKIEQGGVTAGCIGKIEAYNGDNEYFVAFDGDRLFITIHENLRLATEDEIDEGFANLGDNE